MYVILTYVTLMFLDANTRLLYRKGADPSNATAHTIASALLFRTLYLQAISAPSHTPTIPATQVTMPTLILILSLKKKKKYLSL